MHAEDATGRIPGRPGRLDAAVDQELRSHDGPHERASQINLKEILVNSPPNSSKTLRNSNHPGVKAEPATVAQTLGAELVL
jgi:hypothetical protein